MAKRKLAFENDESLIGYISNVTPVKTSEDGRSKYFKASIQVGKTEHQDMVIFSQEKHENFVKFAELDKPVEIKTPRFKPSRYQAGQIDVIVGGNSDVNISSKKMGFTKIVKPQTNNQLESEMITIDKIDDNYIDKTVSF